MVEEAKRYRPGILGVSTTKNRGIETVDLPYGWKHFCSGVDPALVPQAGSGDTHKPPAGWIPLGGKMAILKLRLKRSTLAVLQVYTPNDQSEYASFLLDVEAAVKIAAEADNYVIMGDFNAHVGTDSETWRNVVGKNRKKGSSKLPGSKREEFMLISDIIKHYFHLVSANFYNMVDITPSSKGGKWVCPNDRQLALRAKLHTGWSVKTQDLQEYGRKSQTLNEFEQNIIKQVIQRAELLEQREQERVGRLVDRLDNMKRNILGNGITQCILCGDSFRLFGTSNFLCSGCKKLVCEKCGIEILSFNQEPLWLCKICSETREMWKKSGAWFFKGLPKYKLPEKKSDKYGVRKVPRPGKEKNNWSKSNLDLSEFSNKIEITENDKSNLKSDDKKSQNKGFKNSEDQTKNLQKTSSSLNVNQCEKSPKSLGGLSSASGSLFFNTSSDSGMGESERNLGAEKIQSPKDKYQRETSAESSESNTSSFSRQTSSTFSGSQQNLTSMTTYVSSTNQSYERLYVNCDRNKSDSSLTCDKSPTFSQTSLKGYDKLPGFSRSPQDEKYFTPADKANTTGKDKDFVARNVPVPNFGKSLGSHYDYQNYGEQDSRKYKKKVSIDFGKATSFLKYPIKKDKNKLNKFSSSESHLDSSEESGSDSRFGKGRDQTPLEFFSDNKSSRQTESQITLGANHWLSQESSIHITDSLSDLDIHPKWSRRESMTSLSRDYWSEDQISLPGSLGANQEDTSEALGGPNAQLGILEISLWYDPTRSALHCTLHRGKGLRPTDINGLADPFCKLNILPTCGKSNRLKTKTVHKTVNPEFNETVNFYGITETDIQKKILHILVLDDDKYGNDILGEARIPLFKVGAKQTKHVSVFLEKHYQVEKEDDVWGEESWNRGKILVTLCYSTKKRALIVFIGSCSNLLPMDNNGLSDPFVKLHLTPDPNHKKYKTSVKWKNLNPVFNEEFVFETKMTDLPKQTLVVTVWDKDYGKSNDYLGGLELGWKSKGERLKHWIDVIKFPDHKHEGWHRLGEDLITD